MPYEVLHSLFSDSSKVIYSNLYGLILQDTQLLSSTISLIYSDQLLLSHVNYLTMKFPNRSYWTTVYSMKILHYYGYSLHMMFTPCSSF